MKKIHISRTLIRGTATALLGSVLLTGCNGAGRQPSALAPVVVPPQAYTEQEQRAANPGSLFSDSSSSNLLFSDNRARNIGDIVLVKIVETAKAKNKADTTAERTSSSTLSASAAFGRTGITPLFFGAPIASRLTGGVGADPMLSTVNNSKNNATGETKRENTITATMGVRVAQVMPNGIMQVEGARTIRVNEETQIMVVTGLIRQRDIGSDNSILSTQMADSKIDYYGKGILADKQKAGWLTRLLDNVWPF